jgi:hypothetical protein
MIGLDSSVLRTCFESDRLMWCVVQGALLPLRAVLHAHRHCPEAEPIRHQIIRHL